jgi:hypothetical protein
MSEYTENLSAAEITSADEEIDAMLDGEQDYASWLNDAYADAELARWDDDPSPYDGTYSEM